ncbi:MAG: ribonuclease III [Gammaproteobacteria bacterium]|nr:ribonuclease III [Gammaproteobacteria bacterium]
MTQKLNDLEVLIKHKFTDRDLLRNALTHRSVSGNNNERLEFLGDSILNFVIASELYHRYPQAAEGDLSRLRASLVNKDSLAELSSRIKLGDWLYLGSGELKSGGLRRKSILADALEAIFGAVYLDAGFEAACNLILHLYQPFFDNPIDPEILKDPKTRLQEWLQARKRPLPLYELVNASGKPHEQTFTICCVIEGYEQEILGKGKSRRKAEQQAAENALLRLAKKS